jgi:hypothetical protein
MGKRKSPHKVAEGLARGLGKREAVLQAGYSSSTAEKKAYLIVSRPVDTVDPHQDARTAGVTFDRILQPVIDALDATVVTRTLEGPVKTKLPDHRIRLEAHDRVIKLYGGAPRATDIPPAPPGGLTVIIQRDGGPAEPQKPVDAMPRKIEPQGESRNPPLPVRIERQ